MIFYHIKQQLQRSIDENVFIDQDITNFINTKILKDGDYLNKYYKDFYWRKIRFLNNLEYRWEFAKKKMETLLEPMNETDKIIANLYTLPGDNANLLVQYSIDLNMIIVSKRAVERPYFHHKYPIAVNFARIGMEISKSLLKAVFFIGTQYKDELYATHKLVNVTKTAFSLGDTSCLEGFFCRKPDDEIPQRAKDLFVLEVTSGRFTFKCFKEFLQLIDANQPIPSSELDDAVTYDLLNLRQGKRQPGLRAFDNMQLFSMVYMQNYCSLLNGHYEPFKAFVEMEATATERFNLNWDQVPMLKKSFDCSETRKQCEIIL
ncbi:Protein gone early [Pseudolycoriella hygida]|uniref:Protein gone early n=1 Tax=Pseudolycoriella hygida TaxID=35572 RepID=A0A9Q0MU01_9DIPT|nr:Protein gone early [Pseudolycoriella hygida]